MKRFIGYTLAALLLGAGRTFAQEALWTGDYYVVLGMNEAQEYAVTYGQHLKWYDLKAGPNFKGGTFVDFTLAPAARPDEAGYEMVAVGMLEGQAYSVLGFEYDHAPYFVTGMERIPNMTQPYAAAWAGEHYVVLGQATRYGSLAPADAALPTDVVPFRRFVVSYGRHGQWQTEVIPNVPIATLRNVTFSDLAITPRASTPSHPARYNMLAVGTRRVGAPGQVDMAVTMTGYEEVAGPTDPGRPVFEATLNSIPGMARALGIEWTGSYYVVIGETAAGEVAVVFGFPGAWKQAEGWDLGDARFTALAAAPRPVLPPTASRYDLLAVCAMDLKEMVVSLYGYEEHGAPDFEYGYSEIPALKPLPITPTSPVTAASRTDEGSVVGVPYPNPTAREATFTLTLAREQAVRVEVLDALGRQVAVLHDGLLAAGPHALALDGGALPDGTYLVRAQGEDFVQTRAVVLVR